MFNKRLEKYRVSLEMTKREFAEVLGLSEGYYGLVENGQRAPSKRVMTAIVTYSKLPEEYWLYGINLNNYKNERESLKSVKSVLDVMIKGNLVENVQELFKDTSNNTQLEKLLISALKSDLSYLLEDRKEE